MSEPSVLYDYAQNCFAVKEGQLRYMIQSFLQPSVQHTPATLFHPGGTARTTHKLIKQRLEEGITSRGYEIYCSPRFPHLKSTISSLWGKGLGNVWTFSGGRKCLCEAKHESCILCYDRNLELKEKLNKENPVFP